MTGNNLSSISNGTYLAGPSDGIWYNCYGYIRMCNYLLEKYESSSIKDDIKKYKGEALFFRSYMYFKMYKYYGALPIITSVLDINSSDLYKGRDSREAVENFILQDIEEAIDLLPVSSGDKQKGRITKGAALAFKSRVALFIGTWAKFHGTRSNYKEILSMAVDASMKIIDGSGTEGKKYSLYTGKSLDSYRYLFIDEGDNSSESILDSRYYYQIRTHGNTYGWAWGTSGCPTKKFADMYLCIDGLPIDKSPLFKGYDQIKSEYENRDPRMLQTLLIPGEEYITSEVHTPLIVPYSFTDRPTTRTGYRVHKFIGEKFYAKVGDCEYDAHVIRYAEVLLNYIEAKFERDEKVSDEDLFLTIHELRKRVGMDIDLTNDFVEKYNLDMRTEIRRERAVELAFEGFRYDDIRRWKTAEVELPMSLRGVKISDTEWEEKLGDAVMDLNIDEEGFVVVEEASKRTFETPKHYLYSLPLQQLQMNPNLKPNNPGWPN